jgi:osomolarity two-component system, sensor histidine kinase TcsA
MDDMVNQIFALTPIPSVILSPLLCVQNLSNSFLQCTKSKSDEWHGGNFIALLRNKEIITDAEENSMKAAIDAALQTHEVQYVKTETGITQQQRVIPIVRDRALIHIVVEGLPLRKGIAETEMTDTGASMNEAFRILVSAVKDYAIFLLDTKGNVRTWNAGAELNKGYKPHEIIGKHFSIFYGQEDLKAEKPAKELEICLQEGRVEDEGWRYRKDGTRFWANVVITAVYDKGIHIGFGKVTRDLTERKAAEARLIAAYEESSKLKSEFLANMSHEIRTPMHGMLSACTLLLDTKLTDEQRDLASIIEESGNVLLQVINDILDYSKLASGSFSLSSDIVGIANIISSVVRGFQTTLKPGVHFELVMSPNLPKSVQGDPLRYRQVLQNLIGNAVKFTERGSICVEAHISDETENNYSVLTEVKDTGVGVPEAAKSALFTPFRQFNNSRTKSYQGTGLGLSISKSLVDMMGGQIGFAPNPTRNGSIFWFSATFKKIKGVEERVSLASHSKRAPRNAPLMTLNTYKETFETKHILVAEDNVINQKVMIRMLRSLGFTHIDTAVDGAQAILRVESKAGIYDLILMDIDMPIVDGVTATHKIRDKGFQTPIIALTANALKGDREEFIASGMNDYIPKPVDKELLIRTLQKWLIEETLALRVKPTLAEIP